ncbi:MAG: hypothetical protein OXG81_11845 [Acidobacteria bacterium]|nr:hypothetical protein [Acidobacteriota bacterium]
MAFRLADPEATYPTPVAIEVPAADGKTEKFGCVLHFRLLEASEVRDLALEGDEAYLAGVLAGWEEISDFDGEPLEFNEKNVEKLARIGYFTRSVAEAYGRFSQGLPAKNSVAPLATGSARGAARTRRKKTRARSASR